MRVAEFFSGVGGMGFAVRSAGVEVDESHCLAFDINTAANRVFSHNFPHVKMVQVRGMGPAPGGCGAC